MVMTPGTVRRPWPGGCSGAWPEPTQGFDGTSGGKLITIVVTPGMGIVIPPPPGGANGKDGAGATGIEGEITMGGIGGQLMPGRSGIVGGWLTGGGGFAAGGVSVTVTTDGAGGLGSET